jgi:hypothetical protein
MSWFRQKSEAIKTTLHIAVAVLPILIGGACLYFERQGVDSIYLYIYGLIIPIVLYLTVISELAIIWFFRNMREDDRVIVDTFSDAVLFANKRAEIVSSIKPETVQHHIYSTSHCNLFARPEGETLNQMERVARLNEHLFEAMARITLDPNSNGRLRVLFYAGSQEELDNEVEQRNVILDRTAQSLGRQLNYDHFKYEMLVAKSHKDYLVIDDHVFKTIRKIEDPNRNNSDEYLGIQGKYIHIQNRKIADSYRDWLRDVFENGHQDSSIVR